MCPCHLMWGTDTCAGLSRSWHSATTCLGSGNLYQCYSTLSVSLVSAENWKEKSLLPLPKLQQKTEVLYNQPCTFKNSRAPEQHYESESKSQN